MREVFPDLVSEKFSIGQSIDGLEIYTVRISTTPNIHQPGRNNIKYDGMSHAHEAIGGIALQYWMWWLLEGYETNDQIKSVLETQNLYYTPVGNPDGLKYNEELNPNGGGLHRKNMRRWDDVPNEIGVDLNRNMGKFWGDPVGSSGNKSSGAFRGDSAFSEPEAKAYQVFALEMQFSHSLNAQSCANKFYC